MRLLILSSITLTTVIGSGIGDPSYLLEGVPEDIDLSDLLDVVPTENPTEQPVEWCSWFDDVHLRVRGLQISINSAETRLESCRVPIAMAKQMWNVSAATDHALTPHLQGNIRRVYASTAKWIWYQEHSRKAFERSLFSGFSNWRSQVDADTFNAVLREYAGLLIADRNTFEARLASERLERQSLIDEVRDKSDRIRACLEAQIDGSERALFNHKLQRAKIYQLAERGMRLRELLVQGIEQSSGGGCSREMESALQMDCIRSVKRIVFADGSEILEDLKSDLRAIAKKHGLRHPAVIYQVYLRMVDFFQRFRSQKQQPQRIALERQIRVYEGIIAECRGSITQLLTYPS